MEDITLRALRTFREADVIVCEDTRVTRKLLDRHEISKPTMSYNAHATDSKHDEIIGLLRDGKHLALVTDAGTPGVSDPGSMLVARVVAELGDEVTIEAIPGASALTAALSVAGIPVSEFVFLGFLPHKKGRATAMRGIAAEERPVALYESSHRLVKLLGELAETVPAERTVIVLRELTKLHEEVRRGSGTELKAWYETHPDTVRGECVVIVGPAR